MVTFPCALLFDHTEPTKLVIGLNNATIVQNFLAFRVSFLSAS